MSSKNILEHLCTRSTRALSRAVVVAAFAAVALGVARQASADVSPPGCSENASNVILSMPPAGAVHGQQVCFRVTFQNNCDGCCDVTGMTTNLTLPNGVIIPITDGGVDANLLAGTTFKCPSADPRCKTASTCTLPSGELGYQYFINHDDEVGAVTIAGCPHTHAATFAPGAGVFRYFVDADRIVHSGRQDASASDCKENDFAVPHACCSPCGDSCTNVASAAACPSPSTFIPDKDCSQNPCTPKVCPPDANFCNVETCDLADGVCKSRAFTMCPPDANLCTTEFCDTDDGVCKSGASKTCNDLLCEACDTADGVCKLIEPLPVGCAGETCRTPKFWGTHACGTNGTTCEKSKSSNLTQKVITECGGCLDVCGDVITTTVLNNADSALEAVCVSNQGAQRLLLARQLTSAALNCCISGSDSSCGGISVNVNELYKRCNAACINSQTTATLTNGDVVNCIEAIDCFNNGGKFDSGTGQCGDGGENNCHARDLGLCNDGSICTEDNPCAAGSCLAHGPAGSSNACNAAIGNTCKVVGTPTGCGSGSNAPQSCP